MRGSIRSSIASVILAAQLGALFGVTPSAHGAPRKASSIPASVSFEIVDDRGVTVVCAEVKGRYRSGTIKGARFIPGSDSLRALAVKVKRARSSKARAKVKRLYKAYRHNVKHGDAACAGGPSSAVPSPTASPLPEPPIGPPSGDAVSMEQLERALTREDVRYLLEKAGFGLAPADNPLVERALAGGVSVLVDEFTRTQAEDPALDEVVSDLYDGNIGATSTQSPFGQRQGLLYRWTHTRNPFAEKLALFLLSVWTVSGDVIDDETFRGAFIDYFDRLRAAAYDDCDLPELGVAITADPLMLVYLNNELNLPLNPNENYARELMELFTLGPTNLDGEPNYTETRLDGGGDIAVAARMLTGWRVKRDYQVNRLRAEYLSGRHAPGPHLMFAGTPNEFSGESYEDLVRGIFAHHRGVKYYYAREILKEYLTPDPSRELIEQFANVIAENDYHLRPAMVTLLSSKAFYHERYRDTAPKNSIEFAVETIRELGMENNFNTNTAVWNLNAMGMDVNQSPSVFWFNPASWTSPSVLLERANFVATLLGDSTAQNSTPTPWTPATVLPSGASSMDGVIDAAAERLGVRALTTDQRAVLRHYLSTQRSYTGSLSPFTYDNTNTTHQRNKGMGIYYLLTTHPEFQLK